MTDQSLAGRRIVVTRAIEQCHELVDSIHAVGGEALILPMLEIVDPVDGDGGLASSLEGSAAPDWLVVTSVNGAQRVLAALATVDESPQPKLAVVGPATARVFTDAGWTPDFVPSESNAATLVAEFPDRAPNEGRVLVAHGDLARPTVVDGLRGLGWFVEAMVVYRNVVPDFEVDQLDCARAADAVVFASPSAVRRYVDHVGSEPNRAVCIGPVTGAEASGHGFSSTIAATTSTADIVAALAVR